LLDFPTGGIGAVLSHLGSLIFRPYIDPSEKLENKEQRIKLNLNNKTVKEFNVKIWTLYFKNQPRKVISRCQVFFYRSKHYKK
jgi:UDP-galactopyranose mutase